MGYCVSMRDASFKIKRKNYAVCLQAIKDMDVNEGNGSGGFSWVGGEEVVQAKILKDAFEAWRWSIEENKTGIVSICFEGEKLGDDAQLFRAIAPYVESGSFIEMSGEDGELWRYQFNNGEFNEHGVTLDWEDNVEIVEALLKQKTLLPMLIGVHPSLDMRIEKILGGG